MEQFDRRNFLKISSAAISGAILTSCGSDDGNSGDDGNRDDSSNNSVIPNGYKFYKLKTLGENVGVDSRLLHIYEFGGSVHISKNGVITFDAFDVDEKQGLFQLDVDFSSNIPKIINEYTSLLSGDILSDERVVREFKAHDVNNDGNIAAIIHPDSSNKNHFGAGLYLNDSRDGFKSILKMGDIFHNRNHQANGIMGDISLHDDNSLLFVTSHYAQNKDTTSGKSLIHLENADLSTSNVLLSTGDYINGSDEQIVGLGIVNHNKNGHYSVNTFSKISATILGGTSEEAEEHTSSILSGHILTENDHTVFSTSRETISSTHSAYMHYAPRVTTDGTVYTKIADETKESLIAGDIVIKTTDYKTPLEDKIISFTPGALGSDGIYYYTEYSERLDGLHISLYAYNGTEHRLLLSTGNILSDGGSAIQNIVFSTTTNHIDNDNKIVLLCEFEDKSASIVVGIPS